MVVQYKKTYKKSFKKLQEKIKKHAIERIVLFKNNPFNPVLNNHSLLGKYKGYSSINITGDYRAIFREISNGEYEFVEFINIGTHSQLY